MGKNNVRLSLSGVVKSKIIHQLPPNAYLLLLHQFVKKFKHPKNKEHKEMMGLWILKLHQLHKQQQMLTNLRHYS